METDLFSQVFSCLPISDVTFNLSGSLVSDQNGIITICPCNAKYIPYFVNYT